MRRRSDDRPHRHVPEERPEGRREGRRGGRLTSRRARAPVGRHATRPRPLRHVRPTGRGDAQWGPSSDTSNSGQPPVPRRAANHPGGPSRDRHPRSSQDPPAVHRREVGGQRLGRDDRSREPGRRHGDRPHPGERQGRRGSSRGRRRHGVRDVAAHDAPGPEPAPAQAGRRDRGPGRGVRPARIEERGQARRRGDRRDPGRGGQPALLRGRRAPHGRQGGQRVHGRLHVAHPARAGGRRRVDRAVELPDHDGRLEDRSGPGGGQHGRPQAVGADAAHGPPPGRGRRGHLPARRAQRRDRHGRGDGRPARRPPQGRDGLGDRRHGHRQAHREARRRQGQAPASRARRQGPGRRIRRRRPRGRHRQPQDVRLLEQRPGLHRAVPGDRGPEDLRPLRGRPGRRGQDDQVGRPGRGRRHRDGLAHRGLAGRQGQRHGRPGRSRAPRS